MYGKTTNSERFHVQIAYCTRRRMGSRGPFVKKKGADRWLAECADMNISDGTMKTIILSQNVLMNANRM